MFLYSIASGSSGNSIYIGSDNGKGVLIDAGVSKKRIVEGMENINLSVENIGAVFITHEHSDHIKGLGPLLRKYDLPVYATAKTIDFILNSGKCGKLNSDCFFPVEKDVPVMIDGMEITPFAISHDALDPVCYTCSYDNKKIAVATDLGTYDDYTLGHIGDSDGMLLEANHDITMLEAGSYPYELKYRILGDKGHLSNDACAGVLKDLKHGKEKKVLLGHLSNENNYPALAYETVRYELENNLGDEFKELFKLGVAKRDVPTTPFYV